MSKRLGLVLLAAAVLAGAVLRLPRLDCRPMHTDEAVQAAKTGTLLETGRYVYDPSEYHGPTLPLFGALGLRAAGVRRLADATEAELRMTPVVFGLGLILLTAGFAGLIGGRAALAAAFFLACSPAFVFYSRYYIHETLFVFFSGMFLLTIERYWRSPRTGWAIAAGASFGLLCATKETWIFEVVALVSAFVGARLWARWRHESRANATEFLHPGRLGAAALTACLVAVVLFSDFFTNPRGISDGFLAFTQYTTRAGAALHRHVWYFYFARLFGNPFRPGPAWNEGIILVFWLAGAWAAFFSRIHRWGPRRLLAIRMLVLYTMGLFALYSAVPYKTPWCILGPWYTAICIAGLGVETLWGRLRRPGLRALFAICFVPAVLDLGRQARTAAVRFCTDRRNPWVYAQTSPDLVRLATRVEEAAALAPTGRATPVFVIAPEYWPLPWYFRRLQRVGYWTTPPPSVRAPIIVTAPRFAKRISEGLAPVQYERQYYGLRPAVPLLLLIQPDLWQAWLNTHAPSAVRAPVAAAGAAPSSNAQVRTYRHSAMGTDFAILVRAPLDPTYAGQAARAAFGELDRIEQELSRFIPTSDISRINALEVGKRLRIGETAAACLRAALVAWKDTDGAFDVTARPAGTGAAAIGMQYLDIDSAAHEVAVRRPGLRVDLGGIGKGFALDRMAGVLRDWKIGDALIEGGLSTALVLCGTAAAGKTKPWPLQLRDPRRPKSSLGVLELERGALSGSAAVVHGPHIIDPRTGAPATGALAAWAVAESATRADALSTAFMVMSSDQVRACCDRLGVGAILLTGSFQAPRLRCFGNLPRLTPVRKVTTGARRPGKGVGQRR